MDSFDLVVVNVAMLLMLCGSCCPIGKLMERCGDCVVGHFNNNAMSGDNRSDAPSLPLLTRSLPHWALRIIIIILFIFESIGNVMRVRYQTHFAMRILNVEERETPPPPTPSQMEPTEAIHHQQPRTIKIEARGLDGWLVVVVDSYIRWWWSWWWWVDMFCVAWNWNGSNSVFK